MPDDAALVIIAKAPEIGRIKTRLAAGIGPEGAVAVYRQLLSIVARLSVQWPGPVLLSASGTDDAWTGTGLETLPRRPQPEGGLGSRIAAALRWGQELRPAAIAIGTDCPGLRLTHLQRLGEGLRRAPVAIGPACDGGYWGLAVTGDAPIAHLCDDTLPWSTPRLLHVSLQKLMAAGHTHILTDLLADCDDTDDLSAAVAEGHLPWPSIAVPMALRTDH